MQAQRLFDDLRLVPHTRVVQAGTRPAQLCRRAAQQGAGHGSRGSRVADAHLATNEQLRTLFGRAQGAVAARLQGCQQLVFGHRRLPGKVRGTGPQAQMAHAGQFQL